MVHSLVLILNDQSHGGSLLECTRYNIHRLLSKKEEQSKADIMGTSLKKERRRLAEKKVLFNEDNATVHRAKVAMTKLKKSVAKLIPHPPYYWI